MTTVEGIAVTQAEQLEPCPFCGARPHQGQTKVEHCQLHGEPFQRFEIKCPHTCARIVRPDRSSAIAAWNTRTSSTAELLEALAPLANLQVPKRRQGNAAFYSLLHSDIERAQAVIAKAGAAPTLNTSEPKP